MDERSGKSEFRVVDKRRFNAEGEDRGDVDTRDSEGPLTQSQPAARPQPAPQPQPARPAAAAEESKKAAPRPAGAEARSRDSRIGPGGPESIDFSSFVVSMGTQALMALGEIPNPETRAAEVNLDAAKQMIDILGLLEEKTKGNLTVEEANLMREILSSLQMLFARKAR